MLNQNVEINKTKQFLRIGSIFSGVAFFLLGLILPMPFFPIVDAAGVAIGGGTYTLFNEWIPTIPMHWEPVFDQITGEFLNKIQQVAEVKAHYSWEINVAGLISFLILMFSWMGGSYATFKLSKIITWKDLRIMIFKMQDLMPVTISNSLLEMIRELETMTRQERKQKQVEYVKLINNTIYSYKNNEEKLMAETLKMLEEERAKNKEAIDKAKKWDNINKKVEEDL